MVTGHGVGENDPQDNPFKVSVSSNRVSENESVTIKISGSGFLTSSELRGFIIQVCWMVSIIKCGNKSES